MKNILKIELALQDGMSVETKGDRVIITIDKSITKRDLWDAQIEMWLTKKDDIKTLSGGYFRIIKDKLTFKKWQ